MPLTLDLDASGELGLDTGVRATGRYCVFLVPSAADDNVLTAIASVNAGEDGPDGYTNFDYCGGIYNVGPVTGTGDSLTKSGSIVTFVDAGAALTPRITNGLLVTFSDCGNAGNNGTFEINSLISATSFKFLNASAVNETSAFTWTIPAQIVPFAQTSPDGFFYTTTRVTCGSGSNPNMGSLPAAQFALSRTTSINPGVELGIGDYVPPEASAAYFDAVVQTGTTVGSGRTLEIYVAGAVDATFNDRTCTSGRAFRSFNTAGVATGGVQYAINQSSGVIPTPGASGVERVIGVRTYDWNATGASMSHWGISFCGWKDRLLTAKR